MGTMTLSDRFFIMEKMPLFQFWGVFPTSAAIVSTLVFTSVNMVSRFDVIQPVSRSFMNSVIFSGYSTHLFIQTKLQAVESGLFQSVRCHRPPSTVLSPIRCKTLLDGGRRRTKNLYGVFKRTVPAGQVRQ